MFKCTFEDGHSTTNLRHITATVVVLDKTGQKIFLIKRGPRFSEPNKWALPGGYVDRDETIVEGAAREVLEETGYRITDQKLLRIIDDPNRTHDKNKQNIEFCYIATADKKVGEPDQESSETRWFELDTVPPKKDWAFDHYESFLLAKEKLS